VRWLQDRWEDARFFRAGRQARFLAILLIGMIAACSGHSTAPLFTAYRVPFENYSERIAGMLARAGQEASDAYACRLHLDSVVLPGRGWPFCHPDMAVSYIQADSTRILLQAREEARTSPGYAEARLSARIVSKTDSTRLHPPSESAPFSVYWYSGNQYWIEWSERGREAWFADVTMSGRFLDRPVGEFVFTLEIAHASPDCATSECASFRMSCATTLVAGAEGRPDEFIHPGSRVTGYVSETGPDESGNRTERWRMFTGRVLEGDRAIIETTGSDATFVDTMDIGPMSMR